MDTDKILEKLIRWLSDPKGREMVKTLIYLVFPLLVLLLLRGAARRRTTDKTSSAIQPQFRPATTESLTPTETIKETTVRHQKKMAREMREAFGREESLLAKARKNQAPPAPSKASHPSKSPEPNQRKMLQEELLKLFTRRPN
jgi:flagellar biosynthesis/type III secretory pathway M-ring protein FliF/YscJ